MSTAGNLFETKQRDDQELQEYLSEMRQRAERWAVQVIADTDERGVEKIVYTFDDKSVLTIGSNGYIGCEYTTDGSCEEDE